MQTSRSFDPLVIADDTAARTTEARWLMLTEHPAMPIAIPGGATAIGGVRNRSRQTEINPLRRFLAISSQLLPGEAASAQLLVFGPVPKDWTKKQEEKATVLREMSGSGAVGREPSIRRHREILNGHSGGVGGRTQSAARSGAGAAGAGLSFGPGFWLLTGVAATVCLFFYAYFQYNSGASLLEVAGWLGLGLAALPLFTILAWSKRYAYAQQIQSPAAIEQKISSTPLMMALRLVVSIPLEPYLRYVCLRYDKHFVKQGFEPGRAARLYKVRAKLLKLELAALEKVEETAQNTPTGATAAPADTNPPKLRDGFLATVKLREADTLLWEQVEKIAKQMMECAADKVLRSMADGYSAFQSGVGNTIALKAPASQPEVFSSLHPCDWIAPQRDRNNLIERLWPFNSRLFDAVLDWGNQEVPVFVRKFRYLLILNAEEASNLFHLPGGSEVYDFVERNRP